jgi:4-amino-4-deoxychorismate lyase
VRKARYIDGQTGRIDPADRGLAYGDGLFETIAIRRGLVRYLDFHLERLAAGCARLHIDCPPKAELEGKIRQAAGVFERGTIKLILTRGTGPRGYAPPRPATPTIILLADPDERRFESALAVVTLRTRLSEHEVLAGIKHLCRLEQVLGRLELDQLDADEGLMATTRGTVIGGTSRNLFAVFGSEIKTPDLTLAGIEGVMRRAVLAGAAEAGYKADVTVLSEADLRAADEIFMTNALVGIQSVTRLDERPLDRFSAAQQLRFVLGLDNAG